MAGKDKIAVLLKNKNDSRFILVVQQQELKNLKEKNLIDTSENKVSINGVNGKIYPRNTKKVK